MKRLKKFIFIIAFLGLYLMFNSTISNAGTQEYNSLDFQAYLNTDGSMYVVETWDIYVSNTNTLYKNFEMDKKRFSGITDVKVTDVTDGYKAFKQIYEQMYHVTDNCYYGLEMDDGDKFEIAWGTGLENSTATKKYKIEYVVEDAVAMYNDCSELYWQFVGNNNEIEAQKVTGTIHLPNRASSKDEIKVWGHTEGLNGEIYATAPDRVEFTVNGLKSETFVEVRVAMPIEIISYSGRTTNTDKMEEILKEEERWVRNANLKRLVMTIFKIIGVIIGVILFIVLIIYIIKKTIKYSKDLKRETIIIKPSQEIQYFREIPRENASPAEAKMLLTKYIASFGSQELGDIISATILNLYNDDYIEIKKNKEKNDEITFILKATEDKIQSMINEDEKLIYEYIEKAAKSNKKTEITLQEFKKYIKKYPSKVVSMKTKLEKVAKKKLYDMKYINKKEENEREVLINSRMLYILLLVMAIPFALVCASSLFTIILVPLVLIAFGISIANIVLITKVMKTINVYSLDAIDEMEKWKGLKRFMEDFSQLDKKEIPEIVLWEKYLVYATAFGIADKVLKQLKIVYPDYDTQLDTVTYTHMYLIMHSNLNHSISSSVSSSITSAYSSASGGGGGFSGGGGGGGGRRRKRRTIITT